MPVISALGWLRQEDHEFENNGALYKETKMKIKMSKLIHEHLNNNNFQNT